MITCYVEKDGTVNWGRRNPEPSFRKCIEDNPYHQLSAIVEYCLYNTDNCLQLDKCRITDGLEKIKVLIPESEWPKAINKLMDQVVFYNGTGRECLFDYSETKYGQLEGDPRQEIYDILLVYLDEMQVDEASRRYILNNSEMYKERFSFLRESAPKEFFKTLANKIIVNKKSKEAYQLPNASDITKEEWLDDCWITEKAKQYNTKGALKKGEVYLELGENKNVFESEWELFDNYKDVEKYLWERS